MRFLDSLITGVSDELTPSAFRVTVNGGAKGGTAYFQNAKGIISFCSEEVVVGLKKGCIVVKGEGLFVKKYCGGDVSLGGKVLSLEVRCQR
ncbi:MAG: YabP/YqfC family sporulation protein [Clostridia bacterium]|nr:YabP/YqfC family sporulation protein [Clostridia bacterium]